MDYGELPHIIFHSDMFKSALVVILNTTDDLHVCVCPGISDPALIDIAERKKQHLSYYVDSCGTVVDGEIVKCIRRSCTKCSYMLSNELRIQCHECQDFPWSHMHSQTKPPETFQSKTAHDSHVKLSSLSHAELIARAKNVHKIVARTRERQNKITFYIKNKNKKMLKPPNITTPHLQT